MQNIGVWRPVCLIAALALTAGTAASQRRAPEAATLGARERPPVSAAVTGLRFVVSVGPQQVSDGLLELRAEFAVHGTGPVLLSMPAWTPGAYEIANHARGVMGFAATQAGRPLRWDKLDPDTWRVWPQRSGRVELRYRVRAERLDVAGSWLTEGFGFFNGTNLFLEVEGRPHTPALVAIDVPSDWRVTTGMTPHDSTNVFRARMCTT